MHTHLNFLFSLIWLSALVCSQDQLTKCLDSNTHKPMPTTEDNLFGECKPWKQMSCCNSTSTQQIHQSDTYWNGFNYNHCGRISSECKRRMLQELCLYECDPYLKNFIVGDTSKKMRNERYYKVPLCKKDCDNWFNACKYDFTCRDNWSYGFLWKDGVNYCRPEDKCITIGEMFGTSEKFCKTIWDDSFFVEPSPDKCFTFEFDGDKQNPNKGVAEYYNNSK